MNKIIRIFTVLCIMSYIVFLSSCVKEKFDPPPDNTPVAGLTTNMTIAQLYQYFADSIPTLGIINEDIIISGIVVGNDVSGNIYKTFYIEDGTQGLQISLDMTGIYTTYRLGQRIYIKCNGLYLGTYSGVLQLGFLYNSSIGRIPAVMVPDHFFLDGKPGDAPVPHNTVIGALTSTSISTLVRLDSVYFDINDIGKPFSDHYAATNRILKDKNGSQIIVYTSNYASFAGQLVPDGYGSIEGVVGLGTGNQIYLRDNNDIINFHGVGPLFISEPFTTTLGSFTTYSVTGIEAWHITSFGATMSGWNGSSNQANEDWLISSSINLDNYTNEILSFSSTMNYGNAGDGSLKLYYSTNYTSGAPGTATWTELTGFALSAGAWATTPSGNIDLSAISGTNVHLAFKYVSTTSSSTTWELTNLVGQGTPN